MDPTLVPSHAPVESTSPPKTGSRISSLVRSWLPIAAAGLLAGLVAALVMVLVFALLRWGPGISPPPEAIPDRLAPTIKIQDFFKLLNDYGGYNELKRFGVWTGIRALIGVGAIVGILYALVTERARRTSPEGIDRRVSRTSWLFIGTALLIVWLGTVGFLWPVLDTNFRGVPLGWARIVSVLGLLIGYGTFALSLVAAYRFITAPRDTAQPVALTPMPAGDIAIPDPDRPRSYTGAMARRTFLTAIIGGGAGFAAYKIIRRLEEQAVFTYDGLRPRGTRLDAITPNEKFYVVTKNVIDPDITESIWKLKIFGHVENEGSYSLDDLLAMPQIEQETTLMCISNKVGDILMSNAVWTGVPLHTLLDPAGVRDGAVEVLLHGADGYTDTFSIDYALQPTTMLAFRMNGDALPKRHGFPCRLLVPGLFGEKNVKWITGIEVVTTDRKGFYEQQGWGPNFSIPTRSLFYVPEISPDRHKTYKVGTTLDLRGVAFAPNRGIQSVEVSLDDGSTWVPATIDYPGTNITWSLWSYDWTPTVPGEYSLYVRCTDGTGELQTDVRRSIQPEGATGYHKNVATIVP